MSSARSSFWSMSFGVHFFSDVFYSGQSLARCLDFLHLNHALFIKSLCYRLGIAEFIEDVAYVESPPHHTRQLQLSYHITAQCYSAVLDMREAITAGF